MQINQFINALSVRLNTSIFQDSEGIYNLEFSNGPNMTFKIESKALMLSGCVIEITQSLEEKKEFYKNLLKLNYILVCSEHQTLALDAEFNKLILYQRVLVENLYEAEFVLYVEKFLNMLELWQKIVLIDTSNADQIASSLYAS